MIKGGSLYAVAINEGSSTVPDSDSKKYDNKFQTFVNYGTGLKDVSCQNNIDGMKEGCYFMCVRVIGGLGNDSQKLLARNWAISKGYIESDTYVNRNYKDLAKLISQTLIVFIILILV